MLKEIIRAAELKRKGTISYNTVSFTSFNLDIEAKRMGPAVRKEKKKYFLSLNKQSAHSRFGSYAIVNGYTTNNKSVSLEIRRRSTLANKC